jgi:hypothetical protein
VIADEAHRCAGKVSSSFTTVLNDDLIRSKKKLFTTATPRTYSSSLKKQAEELDFVISGMDDEKVFGTEFYRLSFGNAIERGLLTDYQLVIIGVDEPMIADWIKRRELLQTNEEIVDAKSLAAEIGLIKAIKDYNLKRVLSFHSRVKSAEDFSNELPKVLDLVDESHKPRGKLATGFVSGKMPTNQRRLKLDQLKELTQGDYAVLSNARCLSEGVDVPALDGIAIIDPKASQIDIVQTVGRAIRLSENKSVGTIVLPVFIENGDDPETSIESTNFKPLWDVIKALRSHDEILAFELDSLRTQMGRIKKRSVQVSGLKKIVIDVPTTVDTNFSNALRTLLIENSSSPWNFWYGLLLDYYEKNGSSIVNLRYKTDEGYALGNWVRAQRTRHIAKKLSNEQYQKLEELNFSWELQKDLDEWISYLKQYISIFGNADVNLRYKTPEGINLGAWVGRMRKEKKTLDQAVIDKLNTVGFIWDSINDAWNNAFESLKKYNQKHGDALVPLRFETDDGFKLGYWVSRQRRNRSKLNENQLNLLASINFNWDPMETAWKEAYEYLLRYKAEYNSTLVPNNYICEDGFKLGLWCNRLNRSIDKKKRDKLDAIGFVWNNFEYKWNLGYKKLKEYLTENGHIKVPKRYVTEDGFNLGQWCQTQRSNRSSLSEERVVQLDHLNFIWKFK